jgi:hypothetical protein
MFKTPSPAKSKQTPWSRETAIPSHATASPPLHIIFQDDNSYSSQPTPLQKPFNKKLLNVGWAQSSPKNIEIESSPQTPTKYYLKHTNDLMIAKHYLTKLLDSQIQYTLLETYQSRNFRLPQAQNPKNEPFLCLNLKNLKQKFFLEFLAENDECCLGNRENYEEFVEIIGEWEIGNQKLINTRFTDAYQ